MPIVRIRILADLARDLRYAARALLRTPGFTVVAVAVLALGIGATSAIFSLVSAVWLKPLPFANEERLVSLWVDLSSRGGPALRRAPGADLHRDLELGGGGAELGQRLAYRRRVGYQDRKSVV